MIKKLPPPWEAITNDDIDLKELKIVQRLQREFQAFYRYPFNITEQELRLAEQLKLITIDFRHDYMKYFYIGDVDMTAIIVRHQFINNIDPILQLGVLGMWNSADHDKDPKILYNIYELEKIIAPIRQIAHTQTGHTLLNL